MTRHAAPLDVATRLELLEGRTLFSSYVYGPIDDSLGLNTPIRTYEPPTIESGSFGAEVVGIGDINGDGVPDLAIAEPGNPPGILPASNGLVHLYSGGPERTLIRTLSGAPEFGVSMANMGDMNADGVPDLLIGDPGYDATDNDAYDPTGRAYVYSGADGTILFTLEGVLPDGDFGRVVSRLNDLNADGTQDMIIGAPGRVPIILQLPGDPAPPPPNTPGEVFVFSGANGALLRSHTGESVGDRFGLAIGAPSNTGADANLFAVGAPGFDEGDLEDNGRVYVFSFSGALAYTLEGERAGDRFGTALAVPAMTRTDLPHAHRLVVGAPGSDYGLGDNVPAINDQGRLESFLLVDGSERSLGAAIDAHEGAQLGADLGVISDLNFDGFDEITARAGGTGRVYAFMAGLGSFNSFGGSLAAPVADTYFIAALADVGDLNDDGLFDVGAGSVAQDGSISVQVLSSLGLGPDLRITGVSDNLRYMWTQDGYRPVLFVDGVSRAFERVPGLVVAPPGDEASPTSSIQAIANDGAIYFVNVLPTGERSDLMVLRDGVASTLESLVTSVEGNGPTDYSALRIVKVGAGGHVLLTDAESVGGQGAVFVFHDGVLTNVWTGVAYDINVAGAVVGSTSAAPTQAALWTRADGTTLIAELTGASGINDAGAVIGVRAGTNSIANAGTIATWVDGVVTDIGRGPDVLGLTSGPTWSFVDFGNDGRVLANHLTSNRGGSTLTMYLFDAEDGLRPISESTHAVPNGAVFGSAPTSFFPLTTVGVFAPNGQIFAYNAILSGITDSDIGTLREGSPVTSISAGGVRYAAGVNQYDEVVLFTFDANGWSVRRVVGGLADPDSIDLVLVADPGADEPVLAVVADSQLTIYRVNPDPNEPGHVISGFNGRFAMVRGLTSFTNQEGVVHLAGFYSDGDIVIFYRNPFASIATVDGWNYDNLSQNHLEPRGIATPTIVSKLTAYATSWSGMNLAGIDEEGHIVAVWWSPESVFWQVADLSASVVGTFEPYVGELTAFVTPWGTLHINGTNSMGRVRALWWAAGFGGAWRDQPLPQVFVDSASMTSYVTPWGGLNLVARSLTATQETYVFWWTPETNEWLVDELPVRNALLVLEGRISSFVETAGTVTQNIYGRQEDGSLAHMFWSPGDFNWTLENVTEELV